MTTKREQSTSDRIDYTPGSAVTGGTPTVLNGGIIGYPDRDIAANELDALSLTGVRRYPKASATTFAVGDSIIWDASASQAVAPGLASDGSADLPVAVCVATAASGETIVKGLPISLPDRYAVIRPFVFEFDCEDGVDATEHVLIPAWMNRHGLLFMGAYALVTEVFGGATEDQGIVTVEDEDDNVLCTLTASDGGADAANDVLVGTSDVYTATSGDAAKVVAANKAVQAQVTQTTTGAGKAGKMKVYVDVRPLL